MQKLTQHKLYLPIIMVMVVSELVNMYVFNKTAFGWSFDDAKSWAIVVIIAAIKSIMIAVFFDGMAKHIAGKGDWKYLLLAPVLVAYLVFDGATSNEVMENSKAANITTLTSSVAADSTEYLMYRSELAYWQEKQVKTGWSFQTRVDSVAARMLRAKIGMDRQVERKQNALISGLDSEKGNNFFFTLIGYYVAFGSFAIGLVFLVYQLNSGVHHTPEDNYSAIVEEMAEASRNGDPLPYSYDDFAKFGARNKSKFWRDVQKQIEIEPKQPEMKLKRVETK